ncbi:hypothetical protein IAD21_03329 [Abditibacteriota bacterium]|nr:hypothetical protein IAD21_03329 [Abditibacteriota bacterium]
MRRLFLLACLPLFASCARAQNAKMTHRWFYLQTNFLTDANVTHAQDLLKRAKAAGYNGVVVTDSKFDILDKMSPHYFQNVAAVKQTAQDLGIGVYPVVCTIGYEGGALYQDPQLAEAQSVQNAPFAAHDGVLSATSEVELQNGDFEQAQNDQFKGWSYQDAPGKITFFDTNEKHGGAGSIRMQSFEGANGRIVQTLTTKPHQWLHLSVWVKTQDFETPNEARGLALGQNDKVLAWVRWHIERTQGWTRYDTTFNTGDSAQVRVYLGVWGGRGGQIWWDDAKIEGAGLFNLVRRPGAPFSVRGEDGTIYEEGRDFENARDEKTGNVPWPGSYDDWHDSPNIKLMSNSRIKEGQSVQVSYYAVQKVDEGSVAPCLSEAKTFQIMRDQVKRVVDLWQPTGLFLGPDEIRQIGSCEACQKSGKTSAQILADATKQCVAMARESNPKGEVWIWSDMFDPNHNAHDNYYLVNDSLDGSWQGVDKSVGIMNWNFGSREKSLAFFAQQGHPQIVSGFYDAGNDQIKNWMETAKDVPTVEGAMYTTWNNDYSQLEDFARNAWGK